MKYEITEYPVGNNLCILTDTHGKLSVNIPELASVLGPGEFFVKTYSENAPWYKQALESPYFEDTGRVVNKNFDSHSIDYPIWKVTPVLVSELFEQTYNSKSDIYEAPEILFYLHDKIIGK